MNNQPEIIFHQPKAEYDALRLLFTAHKLASGMYQYHNWLVSPSITPTSKRSGDPAARERRGPNNLIIFPDLPYQEIPNFWTRVMGEVEPHTPPVAPPDLITSLSTLLTPTWSRDSYPGYLTLQRHYHNIKDQFWPTFFSILSPSLRGDSLQAIHIYPTLYGTTKSFSLLDSKTTTLHIYLRTDQGIDALIDGIVSGAIRGQLQQDLNLTWSETEVAKDTLLLTTPLAQFAPDYQSTLHAIRSPNFATLQSQSLTYLKHLGLNNSNLWEIDQNIITYHARPLNNLTRQEQTILTALIQAPDHALSQHDLTHALYPNPNKFSLWGLAKAIQRLRSKLTDNNLPSHLIQTDRNHGYSLFSTPTITKPNDLVF